MKEQKKMSVLKHTIKLSLMFLICILVLSCSSNSNSSSNNKPLQYTVCISKDFIGAERISNELKCGATIDVFECAENGDKIYQNKFAVEAGTSQTYTAQPNVKKIKVYVSSINVLGSTNFFDPARINGWLPLNYYLSPDKTTVIEIDNNTELYRAEP